MSAETNVSREIHRHTIGSQSLKMKNFIGAKVLLPTFCMHLTMMSMLTNLGCCDIASVSYYANVFLLQVLVNSTLTSNMTFTKTSQKFGQWSDAKASTVYGLGFSSEDELRKVTNWLLRLLLLLVTGSLFDIWLMERM